MHFSTFLSRNILRRKTRSLLTTAGIAISIMAVVGLLGVSDGYMAATKAQYELHSVDMVVVRAGVADRLNSSLNEHFGDRLAKLVNVESVNPVLTDRVSLGRETPGGVLVQGLPAWSKVLTSLNFLEGKAFAAKKEGEDADDGGVLLGEQLAKNMNKKVGDTLNVEEKPFRVEGIFQSQNPFENNTAIFYLDDLQNLMERGEQVSEFQLSVTTEARGDSGRMQKLRGEIEDLRDDQNRRLGLAAMPTQDYVASNSQLRIAQSMAWVTSAIALFIGFVGMVNTMFTSVMERTQEIGVLRAIGWKKRRIMSMILGESLLLSLAGAMMGSALAFLGIRILSRFEAAQAFVVGSVPIHVVLTGLVLAVGVGIVGGLYPAIRATGLQPTEALRHD
jgi:putative ABC transport system permease protein